MFKKNENQNDHDFPVQPLVDSWDTWGPMMSVLHKNMQQALWLMAISSGARGTRRHKAQHILLCLCNLASVVSTKTCVTELSIPNKAWLRNVFFQVSRFAPHAAQIHSAQRRTFVNGDDVRVAERGHDLNFSANVNQVLLILDLLFPDWLYGHLKEKIKNIWRVQHLLMNPFFHLEGDQCLVVSCND